MLLLEEINFTIYDLLTVHGPCVLLTIDIGIQCINECTVQWRKLQPHVEVILVFLEPLIANFIKIKTKMVKSVLGLAPCHEFKQNID